MQKQRVAKAPALPEDASEAEVNELRLKIQQEQLRMTEMEAARGTRRRIDTSAIVVPTLALHIPQRTLPFVMSGQLNVARKVWFREILERLKDGLHFWQATQHPVLPGMKKKPKWYNWGDIFGVRSTKDKRPMATLRRHALDQYLQINQLEASGALNQIATFVTDPLRTQIRNRILQRGNNTYEWRFHGEVEPTRCLSFRMIPSAGIQDLPEAEAAVQQALMKFKTKQSLVVRDSRGLVIAGSHDSPRVVTDYFVLEHKNWVDGMRWQLKAQMYDVPPAEVKAAKK